MSKYEPPAPNPVNSELIVSGAMEETRENFQRVGLGGRVSEYLASRRTDDKVVRTFRRVELFSLPKACKNEKEVLDAMRLRRVVPRTMGVLFAACEKYPHLITTGHPIFALGTKCRDARGLHFPGLAKSPTTGQPGIALHWATLTFRLPFRFLVSPEE